MSDNILAALLSATSPTKEANSCDKNGNFDTSKVFIIDKTPKRLSVSSVESFTEELIEEACKVDTEKEINSAKDGVVSNEVDMILNSVEGILEVINTEAAEKHLVDTCHVETTTVVSKIPEKHQNIEINSIDTFPHQKSQDASDSQQVQQLMDNVLCSVESPFVETTTFEQNNTVKPTENMTTLLSNDCLDNLQANQLQDNVLCTVESLLMETTTLEQENTVKPTENMTTLLSNDCLDNLQANQLQADFNEKNLTYREDDSSDDDTSSTFSLSSSSDCSDSFFEKMHRSCSPGNKIPNIKTKGELDLDDLPPIEDLTIDVTEQEMQKVGSIYAVVDKLVIVRALKDLQPLDLDSVLFLSHKETLGRIFDVFGPVVEPFYSVRFNSTEHIAEKNIVIDADVFFAPEKTDITSYVFVDQLKKQKGSDASWQDNNEPPEEYLDYSDDDEERAARRKRQAKTRNRNPDTDDVQVIPNKVSRDINPKNSKEINPWINIQEYRMSLNNTPQRTQPNVPQSNPFRRPYMASQSYSTTPTKPPTAFPLSSERFVNRSYDRYGAMASQGGSSSLSFPNLQNAARETSIQPQYRSQQTGIQHSPVVASSTYFQPQTQFTSGPPPPLSPYPQIHPVGQPMNLMHQSPMSPHPGMTANHRFGQVPFFNSGLPSPMGMPPPASPIAFAYRPEAFMNQQANFPNQLSPFPNRQVNQQANLLNQLSPFLNHQFNQPTNFTNQSSPFLNGQFNQPANFANQSLQQNPLQWQNGPPSPYGMAPLSVSIPNTPPSNAIYTPVPSPYNMWGSKSLNFPQSGYFGNSSQQ